MEPAPEEDGSEVARRPENELARLEGSSLVLILLLFPTFAVTVALSVDNRRFAIH
jgi:hypothetical protein